MEKNSETALETLETDVIIVGAGPIGLACGIACIQNNLRYEIIEKGALVNSLFNYPLNMTFFSTSERLEIGNVPFISHNPKPTRDEALEYYRRVAMHWKLNTRLYERVLTLEKNNEEFDVMTSRNRYHAKAVIIATGFYDIPNLMHIPGESLPKVHHYYKEPHNYYGQKLVVVGAANSAVDVALETWRKGAEVTMVVREGEIGSNVKYWVRPDIVNRIRDSEITAWFNSSLIAIREGEVDIQTPEGLITIPNDYVLAMTGYLPDFAFLKDAGIEIGKDEMHTPIHNSETMETNVSGLYLAGVVCGGLQTNKWFIENSRVHADKIITHLLETRIS
ncbi:YpdA family putative bacillithiol disulfide reductase [Pollutibacter soli]|uniref:YpdA family putative bacillithiol disulfide reductase n=1 Tax=Pollutibacter soli TaxID=3034157 RepID=UPI0030139282